MVDLLGYVQNEDATTTLTWRVANNNRPTVDQISFGTHQWTRLTPPDHRSGTEI